MDAQAVLDKLADKGVIGGVRASRLYGPQAGVDDLIIVAHDLSPADMLHFKQSVFAGFIMAGSVSSILLPLGSGRGEARAPSRRSKSVSYRPGPTHRLRRTAFRDGGL